MIICLYTYIGEKGRPLLMNFATNKIVIWASKNDKESGLQELTDS